jgi:metal-responsive CopG/Arc/MetJ family transcriptional regulator
MKKETKIIGISVDKNLLKKIEGSNYNRSKLIDTLLTKHYQEKNIIKKS